jgi:hypothetical protein
MDTVARTLFPIDLSAWEWKEFGAEGFSAPVSGAIYRTAHPPFCGVPPGSWLRRRRSPAVRSRGARNPTAMTGSARSSRSCSAARSSTG